MSKIVTSTDGSYEEDVLKSDLPVLVDFWAEWCSPCKMIAPILDEIAEELDGKLKVVKMNVDDNNETPAKHGVRGIPTLLMFEKGEVKATKVGALSKAQLQDFINQNLA